MPKSTKRSRVAAAAAHEAFCVAVAGGMSQTDAYAEHVSKDSPYLNKSASTLAKRYRDRIAAIIAENNAIAAAARVLTKQEAMEILTAAARMKPSEASMDNPLCEVAMSKQGLYPKQMDKLGAVDKLAKMLGWNLAEKVEVNHTHADIEAAIDKMFAKRAK